MRMEPPNKNLNWRHEYVYREDGRQTLRAKIVEEYPDEDAIPLIKFLAWLRMVWGVIPEEWRQHAFIKLGSEDSDGYGTAADFDIYLERLETDEEYSARKAQEAADEEKSANAQEARERGMLEALKRKYG
ncbi:MAG: hypothetical protein ACYC2K_07385 [Gemmatimonadales bacterium]